MATTHSVFIDGAEGTTGLQIYERLHSDATIQVVRLPEEARKDLAARLDAARNADLTVLCLPDAAAQELAQNLPANVKLCDASTAHRTKPDWAYGFAELHGAREKIRSFGRVAVPGCHASGFLALVRPLVQLGALKADEVLHCHSLTGYSGGGKKMIAEYENTARNVAYAAPRQYALGMAHKHLPEMQAVAGLSTPPLFCPIVADFYCGMLVSVALTAGQLGGRGLQQLTQLYQSYYQNQRLIQVKTANDVPADGTLTANGMAGRDDMELYVLGNDEHILLCARFDNLGKGASGAAVQCLNLMLGRDEFCGLRLPQ